MESDSSEDDNTYVTLIFMLPKMKESIQKEDIDIITSQYIDYPNFVLGFQHFIHAKKEQLELMKQFEGKKKVYNVVDNFNKQIDEYENDIQTKCEKFINLGKTEKIVDNRFYEIWELLHLFDVATNSSITSLHMTDTGSMVQALYHFRDKYHKNKSDKYVINNKFGSKQKADNDYEEYYKKNKLPISASETATNVNLVIMGLGNDSDDERLREQESILLFLKQLHVALKTLNNKGNMLCQIFENFTLSMNKVLYILNEVFKSVHIIKPLSSISYQDSKYLVCSNYDKSSKIIDIIGKIIKTMETGKYLNNFASEFDLPQKFISLIRKANTEISNDQFKNVNLMSKFIDDNNYYGEKYQMYKDEQINAAKYWTNRYLIQNKDYDNKIKQLRTYVNELVDENQKHADKVDNKLLK